MNMETWAVWPTVHKEKSQEMIKIWHSFGYKVGLLVNFPLTDMDFSEADFVIVQEEWRGFPAAVNILCKTAVFTDKINADIVVVVGDDVYPDPNHTSQKIAEDFIKKFPDTYGVMQPTGDEFGLYDQCAVSPWIGQKFIQKSYDGNGPYREEYFHYFSDQELQEYAIQQNCFQQRSDIIQYHAHWQRKENPKRPEHLMKAKTHWAKDKRIFEQRKRKGFPK